MCCVLLYLLSVRTLLDEHHKVTNEPSPKVVTVIGFPLGASAPATKSFEALMATTDVTYNLYCWCWCCRCCCCCCWCWCCSCVVVCGSYGLCQALPLVCIGVFERCTQGADEVDVVLNIGMLKSQQYGRVTDELALLVQQLKSLPRHGPPVVKVRAIPSDLLSALAGWLMLCGPTWPLGHSGNVYAVARGNH